MIPTSIRARLPRIDARELHTLTLDMLGYCSMILLALAMVTSSFLWAGRSVHTHCTACAPASSQATAAPPPSR